VPSWRWHCDTPGKRARHQQARGREWTEIRHLATKVVQLIQVVALPLVAIAIAAIAYKAALRILSCEPGQLWAANPGQCVERGLVGSREAMQVPLRGDDAGVTTAFLDDLQVGATGEEPGRMSMTQVMNPEPGEPGRLACRVPHLVAEPVGRDVPVGLPDAKGARTVLTSSSPGGSVAGIGSAAVPAG
jgi:hypothetical protein